MVGRKGCNGQAEIVCWVIVWGQCLELYDVVNLPEVREVREVRGVVDSRAVLSRIYTWGLAHSRIK